MNPGVVAPIVALIGLVFQLVFGIDLSEDQLNIITDGIVALSLAVVAVITFFKFKKNPSEEEEEDM